MLLRVLRYRVRHDAAAGFEDDLRAEAIRIARRLAGLNDVAIGLRAERDGPHGVIVSCWQDFGTMACAIEGDIADPLFLPKLAAQVGSVDVGHFETVDEPDIGSRVGARVLRVVRGRVAPGRSEEFYEHLRSRGWPTLDREAGLVAAWVGRQSNDAGDRHIAVTLWRDMASVEAATGGDLRIPLLARGREDLIEVDDVAHYDVIAQFHRRRGAADAEGPRRRA